MTIPSEPIGSIPHPAVLLGAPQARDGADPHLDPPYEAAILDTIARFEETGSPVITDDEWREEHDFRTYGVLGMRNTLAAREPGVVA